MKWFINFCILPTILLDLFKYQSIINFVDFAQIRYRVSFHISLSLNLCEFSLQLLVLTLDVIVLLLKFFGGGQLCIQLLNLILLGLNDLNWSIGFILTWCLGALIKLVRLTVKIRIVCGSHGRWFPKRTLRNTMKWRGVKSIIRCLSFSEARIWGDIYLDPLPGRSLSRTLT